MVVLVCVENVEEEPEPEPEPPKERRRKRSRKDQVILFVFLFLKKLNRVYFCFNLFFLISLKF